MNQMVDIFAKDDDFFAPASNDMIDGLMASYRLSKQRIEKVAEFFTEDMAEAANFFINGNNIEMRYHKIAEAFKIEGALKALNAHYWGQALNMTDVLQVMPQKRRDEWSELIRKNETPEFEESSVRATIEDLLASRHKFFAEKVDGIFRSLSHEHVTNCPQGFNKRMILGGVTEGHYYTSSTQCGHINDLRAVVAKFMGRDEPRWNSTHSLIAAARRNTGQWMLVDGGSMRIRVYLKGTAHLEIHPDIAWRLNQILAHLYPLAIPAEHRSPPKKKHKEFQMMNKPLPFSVLSALAEMRHNTLTGCYEMGYGIDKAVKDQLEKVLRYIGGTKNQNGTFEFYYTVRPVIDEIITSGCIPDHVSHQYYPTPELVAEEAIETADIQSGELCLEPSAGQGGLADFMPKDQTICVELNPLHCKILEAKGHTVINCDFLQYHAEPFDKIIMNPPYSEGRWQAHLQHAASMLKTGGSLVAVLPASAKNKDILPNMICSWSRVFDNEFAGTSVSVVILKAVK
jgi:hypothetical protein